MTCTQLIDNIIRDIEAGLLDDTTPTNDVEYLEGV